MKPLPKDPAERDYFVEQALSDTGFFARNILGMDTDRSDNNNATSAIGEGGIRNWGPHKEMTAFLDNDDCRAGVLWAPRFSYKSSAVKAFITRKVLAHPDIAILLVMHDYNEAEERSAQIRDSLLENETLQEMFGNLKGPVWQRGRWTTSLRQDKSIQQPTLTIASPKKAKTGGRYNLIIFDDVVSETSYLTESGRKEGIRCVEKSLNLRSKKTRYLLIGTPYHPGDANHWVVDQGWERCTHLDVGCDLYTKEDGTLGLKGKARWPNLPKDFLEGYLKDGMTYSLFMSQFKLKVVAGLTQAFQRHHFRPARWQAGDFSDLTGYLLTDVAPSGSDKGDFNALVYVGIDEREHVYVLDVEIGYMKMHEFCQKYLNMLQRWSKRVNHRAELWEESLCFHPYTQYLQIQTRDTSQRLNIEKQTRNQSEKNKDERIASLALRFQANEVHIMDTVPARWTTGTEVRELWNPEGELDDETGHRLPGGDLVEWFIRFPHHQKKDVPDCLALVDAMDRKTDSRVCYYVRPSRQKLNKELQRLPQSRGGKKLTRGYAQRFYDRCRRQG